MNRREAIVLCLAAPVMTTSIVVQDKQTSNATHIGVLSYATRLQLNLAEPEDEAGGVMELIVSYKGKQKKFSAKEIWEALQP